MLQNNLLAEIIDSKKRYSLEDTEDNKRSKKKKLGKIPIAVTGAINNNSMMSYDADVAYTISIPKAHAVQNVDSYLGTSHIEFEIEIIR